MTEKEFMCLIICIAVVICAVSFMIFGIVDSKTYCIDRKRIEDLENKVKELYNSIDL